MTDDLVKRLRETSGKYDEYCWHSDIELEAADRIEWMQDIIARIQYTNLRQDINAESRTIEIEKLCKGKPNEQR
jgi:hypothetical protein